MQQGQNPNYNNNMQTNYSDEENFDDGNGIPNSITQYNQSLQVPQANFIVPAGWQGESYSHFRNIYGYPVEMVQLKNLQLNANIVSDFISTFFYSEQFKATTES